MTSTRPRLHAYLAALGPGLLFAGAAVGVSHLVQSTRAGAVYGLGLIGVALVANLLKYPAFRFGPLYATATGTSLLEGYRRQGVWALWLFLALTLATMFTVLGAVTLVTAGLLVALVPGGLSPLVAAGGLLVLCVGLLAVGQYRWLDRIISGVVVVLTLATFLATALALPRVDVSTLGILPAGPLTTLDILFMAGFVGWMPSAIDISVWHSLWTLARARDSGERPSLEAAALDFNVGYIGTTLLALCFICLGAGVMYSSGASFEASAGGFATQIIDLYGENLGAWSRPIVGGAALLVMFSTTLTVVDGFPRALETLLLRLRGPETPLVDAAAVEERSHGSYWAAMATLCAGAMLVIYAFIASLKGMVDLATTLSFLTAPLLATLNHRAIMGPEVPEAARPAPWLRALSIVGIVAMTAFAVYYLYLRFGT